MTPIELALKAAHDLLWVDHFLVEALEAARKDKQWFEPSYDRDLLEVRDHLDKVELEALKASNMCEDEGLTALAGWCKKIANRVNQAKRFRSADKTAIDDFKVLTCGARNALDAAEEIAAEYSRV